MKNNQKQRILLAAILISAITISIIGTYAYFITRIDINEEQKLTINTGSLGLIFEDNDDGLTGNIKIGESLSKELRIKNTGDGPVTTNMLWSGLINTYLEKSLTYSLEYKIKEDGDWQQVETAHETIPQSEKANDFNLATNLTIPARETYFYKLTITFNNLPDTNQETDKTAIISSNFKLGNKVEELGQAIKLLLSKTNPESITNYSYGNAKEMYTFNHGETTQTTALTDYRYIGDNPNNYIVFNDEEWRIIGIFPINDKLNIKIMRNSTLGTQIWSSANATDWTKAQLQINLNSDYYNRIGDYSSTGLKIKSKSQISLVTWYTGSSSSNAISAPEWYTKERSDTLGPGATDVNIEKYVGIIYPSDYLYTFANNVNKTCFENSNKCTTNNGGNPSKSWIYKDLVDKKNEMWTITPSDAIRYAYRIKTAGNITNSNTSSNVYPVVYLNSNVSIINGDGSKENPYILS